MPPSLAIRETIVTAIPSGAKQAKKALLVEDDTFRKSVIRSKLESIIGQGNVDVASTMSEAESSILNKNYNAYVFGGSIIPVSDDELVNQVGLYAAAEVAESKRDEINKVFFLSEDTSNFPKARELGVTRLYHANAETPATDGVKTFAQLGTDLGEA